MFLTFIEGVKNIDLMEIMKLYVSYIVGFYNDTTIGHWGNIDTVELLLPIVQFWHAYIVGTR